MGAWLAVAGCRATRGQPWILHGSLFLLGLLQSLLVVWEVPFFRGEVGQAALGRSMLWSGGIGIAASLRDWGSVRMLCYPLGPAHNLLALVATLALGCMQGIVALLLGALLAGTWPALGGGAGPVLCLLLTLAVVVECAAPPTWSRPVLYLAGFCLLQPLFLYRSGPSSGLPGTLLGIGLTLGLGAGLHLWSPQAPRR